jgi:C_GCAxxG_C_C family probable redox protein
MNHTETALGLFKDGANCAQAVLCAFADDLRLDKAAAMKIPASFGGGMKQALTCGAVTGALMVLGMKYAVADHTDMKEKARITAITRDFASRFKAGHGALGCKELLGIDISTKEGHDEAAAKGLFKSECTRFITSAIEILEQMGKEKL